MNEAEAIAILHSAAAHSTYGTKELNEAIKALRKRAWDVGYLAGVADDKAYYEWSGRPDEYPTARANPYE